MSAAYVCLNRPLADHMREIAPAGARVATFHNLCWEAAGRPTGAQNYPAQVRAFVDQSARCEVDWDLLVIDEMQDMHPDWVRALVGRLRGDCRLYLLDDPSQCLYRDREDVEVSQAVVVRLQENYRSPRRVGDTINLLQLTAEPVLPCGPLEGDMPGLRTYQAEGGSLVRCTAHAVERCLELGFALESIVVLCWRGLESSRLMALERLQDWRLTRFSGQYDAQGRPVWSEGELRIETVRRFKGQSADAVVLTEMDFERLSALQRKLLFVALTRAHMHVEIVMTPAAEAALMAQAESSA